MKKEEVLEVCIEREKKRIEELEQSLEITRKDAIDAPGSNVSHSDTSKFQGSNLALGIQKRLEESKVVLNYFKSLPIVKKEVISVGAFFRLKDVST